jgi:hypothetical protein
MSLDTYLPVGRGRYRIGNEPQSPGGLYYFMPDSRDHVRVGFEVVRRGSYGESGYSDVVVHTPEAEPDSVEEGEYFIDAPDRRYRVIEFRSRTAVRRFLALGQPGLGRFRFISED